MSDARHIQNVSNNRNLPQKRYQHREEITTKCNYSLQNQIDVPKKIDKAKELNKDADKCVFDEDEEDPKEEGSGSTPFLWLHKESHRLLRAYHQDQTGKEQ